MPIAPHGGGELVDLRCAESEREALRARARDLRSITLDSRELTEREVSILRRGREP